MVEFKKVGPNGVEGLHIGDICRPNAEAWLNYCRGNQLLDKRGLPAVFLPQPVISLPGHTPYDGCAMLAYPFWWWKIEELEVQVG